MKLDLDPKNVIRKGELIESSFGINAADSAHIFGILRSKLYTDKILAVVREYSTNAWDAHEQASITTTPIAIYKPTALDPVFKVRDFGHGLDEASIRTIYVMYGTSTRRADNNAIGGMGIGAKAAFAYTDSFTITSVYKRDGKRYKDIYTAYIDETKVGKIAKMNPRDEETSEPTGVEVKVAVKLSDLNSFSIAIEEVFKFWTVRPRFTPETTKIYEPIYLARGSCWAFTDSYISSQNSQYHDTGYGFSYVVMGQIAYRIDTKLIIQKVPSSIGSMNHNDIERLLSHQRLIIFAPIGTFPIAANREGLEYTDSTITGIIGYLHIVIKELAASLQDSVTKAPSLIDAYKEVCHANGFSWMAALSNKIYTWKSINLNNFLVANKGSKITIVNVILRNSYKLRKIEYKADDNFAITLSITRDFSSAQTCIGESKEPPLIIIDDGATYIWERTKQIMEEKKVSYAYVIRLPDDATVVKKFYDDNHLDLLPTILSSTIDITKIKAERKLVVPNKKYSKKCFIFDADLYKANDCHAKKSTCWTPIDIEDPNFIYIELDNFFWLKYLGEGIPSKPERPSSLNDYLINLYCIDPSPIKLYGIKTSEIADIPKEAIKFENYYKTKFEAYQDKDSNLESLALSLTGHHYLCKEFIYFIINNTKEFHSSSRIVEVCKLREQSLEDKIRKHPGLSAYSLYKITSTNDKILDRKLQIEKEFESIAIKYPMLKLSRKLYNNEKIEREEKKIIIDYINQIDSLDIKQQLPQSSSPVISAPSLTPLIPLQLAI